MSLSSKYRMYPILNDLIKYERIQPLYSEFLVEIEQYKYPIKINKTATDIFRLCNGKNKINDIIEFLVGKYNENYSNVKSLVDNFLEQALKNNHIHYLNDPIDDYVNIYQIGSTDYWTPELVAIELTHKCPLRCKHCYIDAGIGENIETSTVINLFNECIDMGIDSVQLTGGEPMVHPDFFEILDEAMSRGMTVHLFTSGYVNNESVFEKLIKYRNNPKLVVQVSIDGLERHHDNIRGMDGSFDKSMDFIKKVVDLGLKTTIGTCISNQTYEELKELSKNLKDLGVSIHRLSPISNRGRASENFDDNDVEKVRLAQKNIKLLSEELNTSLFKVFYFEEGDGHLNTKYKHNCGLGQTVLKIDPEGGVFPCLMCDIKYANIKERSLLEIQRIYSKLWDRISVPSKDLCGDCQELDLCKNCVNEGFLYCSDKKCDFNLQYTQLCKKISEI